MSEADCRRCVYFAPISSLNKEIKRLAIVTTSHRKGRVLGWCSAFQRGITYYTGVCSKFMPIDGTMLRWVRKSEY